MSPVTPDNTSDRPAQGEDKLIDQLANHIPHTVELACRAQGERKREREREKEREAEE